MPDKTTLELSVERMSYGPDAIAHTPEGKTVFVRGGVPGDVALVSIDSDGSSFSKGHVVDVIDASADRVMPRCPYASLCGGCPWAQMAYPTQAAAKRAGVIDALTRIGHFPAEESERLVAACVSPSAPWGYRNKVELAFSRHAGRPVVGMHAPEGAGVVKVSSCMLLDKAYAGAVKSVAGAVSYLAGSCDLEFERIGIRASTRTRELEVSLWGAPGGFPRAHAAKIISDSTKATSIVRVMEKGPAKARRIAGVEALFGSGSWGEIVGSERMRVSAPSFFQVNTLGAEKLVELVMDALGPGEEDEAMDLYCGAGTFTLPLARRASFVSAVESYGPAVRDLRRNLESAGLDNVDAVGGDAKREFPDTDADLIVVDPPRAGLAEDVVRCLSDQPARSIAYVSCDPATLARDLARFVDMGSFRPMRITPVDLFPQTFHVENVALLSKE